MCNTCGYNGHYSQMTHMKVYENNVDKLVKVLPMDDDGFIMKLSIKELLPNTLADQIKSLTSQSEKAIYFLNRSIKPSLEIDDVIELDNLLVVMEECGYSHVQRLATKMRSCLGKELITTHACI